MPFFRKIQQTASRAAFRNKKKLLARSPQYEYWKDHYYAHLLAQNGARRSYLKVDVCSVQPPPLHKFPHLDDRVRDQVDRFGTVATRPEYYDMPFEGTHEFYVYSSQEDALNKRFDPFFSLFGLWDGTENSLHLNLGHLDSTRTKDYSRFTLSDAQHNGQTLLLECNGEFYALHHFWHEYVFPAHSWVHVWGCAVPECILPEIWEDQLPRIINARPARYIPWYEYTSSYRGHTDRKGITPRFEHVQRKLSKATRRTKRPLWPIHKKFTRPRPEDLANIPSEGHLGALVLQPALAAGSFLTDSCQESAVSPNSSRPG